MNQNGSYQNNQLGGPGNAYRDSLPPTHSFPSNNSGSGTSIVKVLLIIFGVVGVVGLLMCGGLIALLLPAVNAAREAAKRMVDENNLKQIGLAMHNYESGYKRLPAPKVFNSENMPVFSWSVPILPYIEENTMYAQINWKDMQPWNSPSNAALFDQSAPESVQCHRANRPITSNEGHVFLISAPTYVKSQNPIFIDGQWTKFSEITDGLSHTIMAIQLVKHSAPWASPVTLTFDEAYQLIQNEDNYFLALMADGRVLTFQNDIDETTFHALVTRDGGEVPDFNRFVKYR